MENTDLTKDTISPALKGQPEKTVEGEGGHPLGEITTFEGNNFLREISRMNLEL